MRANETAELSLTLQVGAVTEQVDVTASAPLLDTQTADQSVRIETKTMQNLPINTRTPFAMVWANAGISEAFDIRNSTGDQNFDRFGMNGGRTESTLILLDGVSGSKGSQWNGLFYSPTLDAVQEVQIVRNSYDAQFGKSGGGVFSIVTKGGSSQFHGAAYGSFLQPQHAVGSRQLQRIDREVHQAILEWSQLGCELSVGKGHRQCFGNAGMGSGGRSSQRL